MEESYAMIDNLLWVLHSSHNSLQKSFKNSKNLNIFACGSLSKRMLHELSPE
jgi:hypothetical protein